MSDPEESSRRRVDQLRERIESQKGLLAGVLERLDALEERMRKLENKPQVRKGKR